MGYRDRDRSVEVNVAKETLEILDRGEYTTPSGSNYNILKDITSSKLRTIMYKGEELTSTATIPVGESTFVPRKRGLYKISNRNTLEAAKDWVAIAPELRVAILNFASAKHPGGGFTWGALAQEEFIAYRSSLYTSLLTCSKEYYEYNKQHLVMGLYNDNVIYSPDVVVFRESSRYQLTRPYRVNIITCAAPNRGAALRNGVTDDVITCAMDKRIQKLLEVAIRNDIDILILGAFGCGAFKNNPYVVSKLFRKHLISSGYLNRFHHVDFAIPGGKNLQAFQEGFGISQS